MGLPDFAYGLRLLGLTDQGGRGDGVQGMVHDGHVVPPAPARMFDSRPGRPRAVREGEA